MPDPFVMLLIFVVGACVGSFLNVCIYRLPLDKSILWPGSRCGHCFQPIKWYDNIPLVSYWVLRGRCRKCGSPFSMRYFLIELFTALSLVGLYYLEVVQNMHHFDKYLLGPRFERALWVTYAFHALLYCFLVVATFTDFDRQVIPLSITVVGTLVGLVGSVLWPWPWPYTYAEAVRGLDVSRPYWYLHPNFGPRTGVYLWPVWLPLPSWLGEGDNWQTGLATSVAGLLAGTLMLRAVRFLFGLGMGAEYMEQADAEEVAQPRWWMSRLLSWLQRVGGRTLGLGDADLMMMAGSFLGWQPTIVAFFAGVFPGLFFALAQKIRGGENIIPFGPSLAIGVVITWLSWYWLVPRFQLQPLFFDTWIMPILAVLCVAFMVIAGVAIRVFKRLWR